MNRQPGSALLLRSGSHPSSSILSQFPQCLHNPLKDFAPIATTLLPEQPHARIPRTVVAVQQPAPVRSERQSHPDGNAQRPAR